MTPDKKQQGTEPELALSDRPDTTAATQPEAELKQEYPDTALFAEERQLGGPGVCMVKKSMDDISYEYKNLINILNVTKTL